MRKTQLPEDAATIFYIAKVKNLPCFTCDADAAIRFVQSAAAASCVLVLLDLTRLAAVVAAGAVCLLVGKSDALVSGKFRLVACWLASGRLVGLQAGCLGARLIDFSRSILTDTCSTDAQSAVATATGCCCRRLLASSGTLAMVELLSRPLFCVENLCCSWLVAAPIRLGPLRSPAGGAVWCILDCATCLL